MATHRRTLSLAYPRRAGSTRSTTRVDYHSLVLVLGLLSLAAFAGVLYLSQASVAAELRFRLDDAEWQTRDLRVRNMLLQQEIADSERLAAIEDRAARLRMASSPSSGKYVVCVVPQAQQAERQPFAVAVEPQQDRPETAGFWSGLAQRLGLAR
jgi:hypothetical protein